MTTLEANKSKNSSGITRSGRLFVLELSGDRICSMNPDGSDRKTIVTDCHLPDGMVVDAEAGHICWTNMGIPTSTTARSSELFEPVGDFAASRPPSDFALSAADRQDRKSTTRADLLQRSQPVACPITVKSEERNVSKSSPLLPSS